MLHVSASANQLELIVTGLEELAPKVKEEMLDRPVQLYPSFQLHFLVLYSTVTSKGRLLVIV